LKFQRPTPAFTAIDKKLISIQLIYCAVNLIASAYFGLGFDAFFLRQISALLAIFLFVSILLGPPVTLLIVIAINITCYYTGHVLPNSVTSCLMIGSSVLIICIDLAIYPAFIAGI